MEPRYPSPSRARTYKQILKAEAERRGVTVDEIRNGIPTESTHKKIGIKMVSWKNGWYR